MYYQVVELVRKWAVDKADVISGFRGQRTVTVYNKLISCVKVYVSQDRHGCMLDHKTLCDMGTKFAQLLAELIHLWADDAADVAPAAGPSHVAEAAANDADGLAATEGTAAATAAGGALNATMEAAATAAAAADVSAGLRTTAATATGASATAAYGAPTASAAGDVVAPMGSRTEAAAAAGASTEPAGGTDPPTHVGDGRSWRCR